MWGRTWLREEKCDDQDARQTARRAHTVVSTQKIECLADEAELLDCDDIVDQDVRTFVEKKPLPIMTK